MPQEETKQLETTQEPLKTPETQPGAVLAQLEAVKDEVKTEETKPESTGPKQDDIRDPVTGKILPGHSLNPAGRPKGAKGMSTLLKDYLKNKAKTKTGEEITLDEAIIRKLTQKAVDGHDKSIEMIFDRMEGKPVQRTAITDSEGRDLIDPTTKELVDKALGQLLNVNPGNNKQ